MLVGWIVVINPCWLDLMCLLQFSYLGHIFFIMVNKRYALGYHFFCDLCIYLLWYTNQDLPVYHNFAVNWFFHPAANF